MSWRRLSPILMFAMFLACTGNDTPSVEKAREFKAFDIWWLGAEFEEFGLSDADETSFLYGTCKPPPRDGGCAPPAQVILQELCSLPPFDFEPKGAEEVLRGAATFLPVRDGQALVRTGTAAITLFGQDDAMTRRMAESLESLNLDNDVVAREPMPPPVSCSGPLGALRLSQPSIPERCRRCGGDLFPDGSDCEGPHHELPPVRPRSPPEGGTAPLRIPRVERPVAA